jgi:hypothetical protein
MAEKPRGAQRAASAPPSSTRWIKPLIGNLEFSPAAWTSSAPSKTCVPNGWLRHHRSLNDAAIGAPVVRIGWSRIHQHGAVDIPCKNTASTAKPPSRKLPGGESRSPRKVRRAWRSDVAMNDGDELETAAGGWAAQLQGNAAVAPHFLSIGPLYLGSLAGGRPLANASGLEHVLYFDP